MRNFAVMVVLLLAPVVVRDKFQQRKLGTTVLQVFCTYRIITYY